VPFTGRRTGLMRHRAVIEQRLFARVSELLPWIGRHLYDLSNTFFEGEPPATPRPSGELQGEARDCPLVTLDCARWQRLCARSPDLDGNVVEGTTRRTCSTGWVPHGARWW